MANEFHDEEVCQCGSVRFVAVLCPDQKKYIDMCKDCGDCGSHLCDDITCDSNAELAQRLKDEEAIAAGEARYHESVLREGGDLQDDVDDFADAEIARGYANPDYLDSSDDFEGDLQ